MASITELMGASVPTTNTLAPQSQYIPTDEDIAVAQAANDQNILQNFNNQMSYNIGSVAEQFGDTLTNMGMSPHQGMFEKKSRAFKKQEDKKRRAQQLAEVGGGNSVGSLAAEAFTYGAPLARLGVVGSGLSSVPKTMGAWGAADAGISALQGKSSEQIQDDAFAAAMFGGGMSGLIHGIGKGVKVGENAMGEAAGGGPMNKAEQAMYDDFVSKQGVTKVDDIADEAETLVKAKHEVQASKDMDAYTKLLDGDDKTFKQQFEKEWVEAKGLDADQLGGFDDRGNITQRETLTGLSKQGKKDYIEMQQAYQKVKEDPELRQVYTDDIMIKMEGRNPELANTRQVAPKNLSPNKPVEAMSVKDPRRSTDMKAVNEAVDVGIKKTEADMLQSAGPKPSDASIKASDDLTAQIKKAVKGKPISDDLHIGDRPVSKYNQSELLDNAHVGEKITPEQLGQARKQRQADKERVLDSGDTVSSASARYIDAGNAVAAKHKVLKELQAARLKAKRVKLQRELDKAIKAAQSDLNKYRRAKGKLAKEVAAQSDEFVKSQLPHKKKQLEIGNNKKLSDIDTKSMDEDFNKLRRPVQDMSNTSMEKMGNATRNVDDTGLSSRQMHEDMIGLKAAEEIETKSFVDESLETVKGLKDEIDKVKKVNSDIKKVVDKMNGKQKILKNDSIVDKAPKTIEDVKPTKSKDTTNAKKTEPKSTEKKKVDEKVATETSKLDSFIASAKTDIPTTKAEYSFNDIHNATTKAFESGSKFQQIVKDTFHKLSKDIKYKGKYKSFDEAMTSHLVRTDFDSVKEFDQASARQYFKDNMDTYKTHKKEIDLLSKSMRDSRYMNSPDWRSNPEAIAYKVGKNGNANVIDKLVSLKAMTPDDWKFIDEYKGTAAFEYGMDLLKTKKKLSDKNFKDNPANNIKGYFKEDYTKIDTDLSHRRGAMPLESRGKIKGEFKEFEKGLSKAQKEDLATLEGMGLVMGNMAKYGKKGESIIGMRKVEGVAAKRARGLNEKFGDVMGDTLGASVRQQKITDMVVPTIKANKDTGLFSATPQKGMRKLSDQDLANVPREVRDTVRYIKSDLYQPMMGNLEVGYKGTNQNIKMAQAILKDSVGHFKENVVLKNPVSYVNNFGFAVAMGLQNGISPAKMYKHMKQSLNDYSSLRAEQKNFTNAFIKGDDVAMNLAVESMKNNDLYKLSQNGMSMSIISEVSNAPSFSKRVGEVGLRKLAHKLIPNAAAADKATDAALFAYLSPNAASGKFLLDTFTKIDVMGRYAIAKDAQLNGATWKEAAQKANTVFGDLDKLTPTWVQGISEFGGIPFGNWYYRVAAGLGKNIKDNPGKALLITGGLYGAGEYSGKRTESFSPAMTLVNTPYDMAVMSPWTNPVNFLKNIAEPSIYKKVRKADGAEDMVMSDTF